MNADEDGPEVVAGDRKSRLNLWLAQGQFPEGWGGVVWGGGKERVRMEKSRVVRLMGNIVCRYRYTCPRAIGYNPIVPLVFPARCSASSSATSNLFRECFWLHTSRLAPSLLSTSCRGFPAKIQESNLSYGIVPGSIPIPPLKISGS